VQVNRETLLIRSAVGPLKHQNSSTEGKGKGGGERCPQVVIRFYWTGHFCRRGVGALPQSSTILQSSLTLRQRT